MKFLLLLLLLVLIVPRCLQATSPEDAPDWLPVLPVARLLPSAAAAESVGDPLPATSRVRFDTVAQPLGLVFRQLADRLGLPFLAPPEEAPFTLPITLAADVDPWELLVTLATRHGQRLVPRGELWVLEPDGQQVAVERFHELRHRTLEEFALSGPPPEGGLGESATAGAAPDAAAALARVREVLAEPEGAVAVLWDAALARFWVRARPAAHDRLAAHLAALDQPVPQVLLEVRFVQTSEQPERLFGMDWSLASPGGFGLRLSGLEGSLDLNRPRQTSLPVASWSADDLAARLHLLDRDQRRHEVRLVRQTGPSGRPLSFRDTQRIPVVQSTARLGGDSISSQSSIEFLDVGTLVDLVPRVLADGAVALRLDLVVSAVTGAVNLDGNDYPVTSRQAYAGEAVVPAGGTLALGGFERSLDQTEASGLPGLRRLPGLGPLFGTKGRRGDRTHLVVLLTPRVLAPATAATTAPESPSP